MSFDNFGKESLDGLGMRLWRELVSASRGRFVKVLRLVIAPRRHWTCSGSCKRSDVYKIQGSLLARASIGL